MVCYACRDATVIFRFKIKAVIFLKSAILIVSGKKAFFFWRKFTFGIHFSARAMMKLVTQCDWLTI